jgi:hypothetical protein
MVHVKLHRNVRLFCLYPFGNKGLQVDRVKFQFSIFTGAEYSGATKSFSKTYDLYYYVPKGYSSGGSKKLSL